MAKRKKKRRVIKFKNVFIFLGILFGLVICFYFILTMPVKNIYISGNKLVSDNEVRVLSGLEEYPSFLLTKKSDIKKRLLSNPYIHLVGVSKKFGNIIHLSIKEYQVIALSKDNKLILSNGMKIDNTYDLSDIPVLLNDVVDEGVYHQFALKFEQVDKGILRQISEIEYSPVDVDGERFLLYMNDGNLVYITLTKINKLNRYNSIKDKLGGKIGTIYLDAGDYMEVR